MQRHYRSVLALLLLLAGSAPAAELTIHLPLARTAYQTNERIDLAVQRSHNGALDAGELTLKLLGPGGSELVFAFPVAKVEASGGKATAVEHLHVNGWALRPGHYTVAIASDGATAKKEIEVCSHLRKSSFKLINWGKAKGKEQLPQGEDNLGYNVFYGHYGQDEEANFIRAGVDFIANCTMGGGHQMDLRLDCDWSDPYVIRGGTRRVVRRAFIDRSRGNVTGVHFYDEPGLTWIKHPVTGEFGPQGVTSQLRSYEAAFGQPPLAHYKVDPKNPEHVKLWRHWARWKLGFMDAAWKDAQFGVNQVRPDYLTITQSQYGYSAFTDGYYFNVVRSLPIISGHGGYHDYGPGYFNPSMFLEFARARDFARPNWYLPTWYGNTTSEQYRLEQYLSFQTGIQGLMSPPDLEPGNPRNSKAVAGIVETNKLCGQLGTIFTTMKPARPPIAMLYSLSHLIHAQTQDRKLSYAHDTAHGRSMPFVYLACKLLQQQALTIVDEDILDGTLAASHKAVILPSIDHLDADVVSSLEAYIKQGGLVLATADSKVQIKGAIKLDVIPAFPDAAKIEELNKAGKQKDAAKLTELRHYLAAAQKIADVLKPQFDKAGIAPVIRCDQPGIVATKQGEGDVDYYFAVNATHDAMVDPILGIKPVTATLSIPGGGGLYDAVRGGPVAELPVKGDHYTGAIRFGQGQMRVFARTARPIGSIKVGTPTIQRDYTLTSDPLRLELSATLLDDKGGLLSGSFPLRVRVIDPLGQVRYELHRATKGGVLQLTLPLALNDAAGQWTVQVSDLVGNTVDTATCKHATPPTCSIAAGASPRAVHLAQERDNIFRFFRTHQKVTIVTGTSPYHAEAAARLVKILKPWNVTAVIMEAADAVKARTMTADEVATWIGLQHTNKDSIKVGDKNDPLQVGFAVQGPVILLGTPEDNPLVKFIATQRFLPYAPTVGSFPGPGRGYVAWQRDAVGVLQESICLLAHDAAGLSEAVGTMYEMAAGMEPLTALTLAKRSSVTPQSTAPRGIVAKIDWQVHLPDRIHTIYFDDRGVFVVTAAGQYVELDHRGKIKLQKLLDGPALQQKLQELLDAQAAGELEKVQRHMPARRLGKLAIRHGRASIVATWGGTLLELEPVPNKEEVIIHEFWHSPQDVTALRQMGHAVLVGDAEGRLTALRVP